MNQNPFHWHQTNQTHPVRWFTLKFKTQIITSDLGPTNYPQSQPNLTWPDSTHYRHTPPQIGKSWFKPGLLPTCKCDFFIVLVVFIPTVVVSLHLVVVSLHHLIYVSYVMSVIVPGTLKKIGPQINWIRTISWWWCGHAIKK